MAFLTFVFRTKAGRKAVREIQYYQKTMHNLIPKLSFCRVVKEVMVDNGAADFRIQSLAIEALQEATEAFLIRYMEEANMCAIHAKRVTLMPKDMELIKKLKYNTMDV